MGSSPLEDFLRSHGITPPRDNLFSIGRMRNILQRMGCVVDEFNGGLAVNFNLRDAMKKDAGFIKRVWHSLASPLILTFIFTLDGVKINGFAVVEKLRFPKWARGSAYEFCNSYNSDNRTPRAYLDKAGRLRVDMTLFVGMPMSDEFAANEFERFLGGSMKFFLQAARKFL